jgi:hypothetical protein
MRPQKRPWQDVPRLLRARARFRTEFEDPNARSSVPAFLAWKALLIVAKGSSQGGERSQCAEAIKHAMASETLLRPHALAFVKNLQPFRSVSPAVVRDWYVDPQLEGPPARERVDYILRQIKRLAPLTEQPAGSSFREEHLADLADQVYAVRCAVIAHVSVLSTGNLFQTVVPAFEDLTAGVALSAWAERARLTLREAEAETGVHITK